MLITNLKTKIVAILGITLSLGVGVHQVNINVNIQTKEFYEQLADGKLYVNAFNQKAYKEVKYGLNDKIDTYLNGGEIINEEVLGIYLKVVSLEDEKDIVVDNTYNRFRNVFIDKMDTHIDGSNLLSYQALGLYLQMASREAGKDKGWTLKATTQEEFLNELNTKLKSKIK